MRKTLLFVIVLCTVLCSCIHEDYDNSPLGNFNALWNLMDRNYCFFDYKAEEYGLDWNKMYSKYRPEITDTIDEEGLFNVLNAMLGELRDGHVNLYSIYDLGRYWSWKEDYPVNYYPHIRDNYLGSDFKIGGGFRYKILNDGNVGYMYYGDFTGSVTDGYMDRIMNYFMKCKGIIIDVRNNGGGYIFNVNEIMSRFVKEPVMYGYMRHKTGPGHSEFSDYEEMWVEPSQGYRWKKPVAILTNRGCFSATNSFVSAMSVLPQVMIFGDRTGGGGGVPLSLELPNGWSVRYSSSPMYDINKKDIEFGVEPDVRVDITAGDLERGIDTILETAIKWVSEQDTINNPRYK